MNGPMEHAVNGPVEHAVNGPTVRRPLLLGHFGGNNAGDEAILDGTCHLLAACGAAAARVVARRREFTPRTSAAVALEVVPAAPRAVLTAVRDASGVVLCGGTHFEDGFPLRRRLRHYRYLARYLAVLAAARVARRNVVAIGQGFGPLDHPAGRALTRALFALVHTGTARDDASAALAAELGAGGGWERTFDTAAAAPTSSADARRDSVAVAPVRHADPALWDACAGALALEWPALTARRVEVCVFRSGTREDDHAVASQLSSQLSTLVPAPCATTVFDGDVAALLDVLGSARIALCGRYHSLVLAVLAGAVPIVLPAHPKLLDAAAQLGLPAALVVREPAVSSVAAALRAAAEFDARKLEPVLDDLRDALVRDQALLALCTWEQS